MFAGRIMGERPAETNERELGLLMAGVATDEAAKKTAAVAKVQATLPKASTAKPKATAKKPTARKITGSKLGKKKS
jgi:hypothetical protein